MSVRTFVFSPSLIIISLVLESCQVMEIGEIDRLGVDSQLVLQFSSRRPLGPKVIFEFHLFWKIQRMTAARICPEKRERRVELK